MKQNKIIMKKNYRVTFIPEGSKIVEAREINAMGFECSSMLEALEIIEDLFPYADVKECVEIKTVLTEGEIYDLMSVVNDKLTFEEIKCYYYSQDLIQHDTKLTNEEKLELQRAFNG